MKLRCGLVLGMLVGLVAAAEPVPRFEDAGRRARIEALRPKIEAIYREAAAQHHLPGVVHGIVLDGELIHAVAFGTADTETKRPVTLATRFRVASMSKSFTAMAILRLRDAGKLTLADRVDRHLPEFKAVRPPTADAPALRIDHLIAMLPGFPTDDPWGDRQLAVSDAALREWTAHGYAFATTPGTNFEYSNLAYTLLGQIVTRVAGEPYQTYITREILRPLGMKDSVYEPRDVPAEHWAHGYRWEDDRWQAEPVLGDGAFGAMGGLVSTLPDFARYAAFHLAAWPPRDDVDAGPVSRATVREMHLPHGPVRFAPEFKAYGATLPANASGYAYGLISVRDANGTWFVRHSGGLPGYGSQFMFCPELGLALISFANRTYAGMSTLNIRVLQLILDEAKLPPRQWPVTPVLARRLKEASAFVQTGAASAEAFAENVFLDRSRESRLAEAKDLLAKIGNVTRTEAPIAESRLRGRMGLVGERGRIEVAVLLSPEAEARIQELRVVRREER